MPYISKWPKLQATGPTPRHAGLPSSTWLFGNYDSRVEDINDRRRLPHRASSSGRCNAIDYCTQCQTAVDLINLGILGRSEAVSDEECETPCTYTECILSVFLSGIPSVYVTGGYTEQRWTSSSACYSKKLAETNGKNYFPSRKERSEFVQYHLELSDIEYNDIWMRIRSTDQYVEKMATNMLAQTLTHFNAIFSLRVHPIPAASHEASLVHSNFLRASLIGVYEGQFNPTSRVHSPLTNPFHCNMHVAPASTPTLLTKDKSVLRESVDSIKFSLQPVSLAPNSSRHLHSARLHKTPLYHVIKLSRAENALVSYASTFFPLRFPDILHETRGSGGKRKVEINSSLDLQSSSIREDPSKLVVYPYSLPGHPAYAVHGVPSRRSLAAAPNSVGEILTGMSDNDKNKLGFIGARLDFIMTVTYVSTRARVLSGRDIYRVSCETGSCGNGRQSAGLTVFMMAADESARIGPERRPS
ncbi:hypothetical protein EAG_09105 [Camponotus floridanus]|uniref:Uncharacterized protein n=1 Tax=Camponotus floridanus TaxID=104421 RepID=E2AHB4_CAMFO|nr:hypothetical protein EAG_09105 [Camponotus floridanus]